MQNRNTLSRALAEVLESRRFLSASAGPWKAIDTLPAAKGLKADIALTAFEPYALTTASMKNSLSKAPVENVTKYGIGLGAGSRLISVPTPDGDYASFRVVESSIMDPKLAKKFPDIKTYAGVGVTDPTATIRLDVTPLGFHAQVLTTKGEGAYYVEPYYHLNQSVYASYYGTDNVARGPKAGYDDIAETAKTQARSTGAAGTANRTSSNGAATVSLRTYRLAVAATGEYTAFFGGTVAAGQAAIVTAMNRVNGIYETELAIRMTLVANNSSLVFTNASTDPYTNTNGSTMLGQNQTRVDSVIGTANYDIGHVFSTGGGGVAYLNAVGNSSIKAGGVTGSPSPTGDAFWVDYVAHEMGHQWGGNHTFNTSTDPQRNAATSYEPGSGSTIMGYAGITADDLQPNSDPYFAWKSVDEILTHADVNIPSLGVKSSTPNHVPAVSGPGNFTIPANTPFALTATGSDADNDAIYYSWEQADAGTAATLEQGDVGSNAIFRVYNPTTNPTRTFPQLSTVLAGLTQTAGSEGPVESLPTTSRTMKFVVTARDKKAAAGGTNVLSGTTTNVTSVAAASGFAVTSFNSAAALTGGTTQTITWNVAGTTANGINTANVQLLMSTDNGASFPYALAASTANDGTEAVTLPTGLTSSQVRFKVAAVGNIYFDINNAALSITPGVAAVSATPGVPDLAAAYDTGASNTDNVTRLANNSAGNVLQFTVGGTVSGATVGVYSDGVLIGSAVASGTTTTVTTTASVALNDGVRQITARQTESGKTLSALSAALPVTIDATAPTFAGSPVFTFTTNKPRVVYSTSEPIYGASTLPTVVRNSPNPAGVALTVSVAGTNFFMDFPSSPDGILPNGDYTATTVANSLNDLAGNTVAAGSTLNFFYAAGDANRDRTVDFNDFLALQTNFGSAQLNYTKGDFNYDGVIDFNDFLILQTNFGTTV